MYTQLSNPQVTSPEAKKIQQDICVASQRGQDPLMLLLSGLSLLYHSADSVLSSLYSTLSAVFYSLPGLLLPVCDAIILCVFAFQCMRL